MVKNFGDFVFYIDYLQNWIKKKVIQKKGKGVIVCLSGGIDSSVMSLMAKKTFPENHLILLLPCLDNYLIDV